MVFVEAKHHKRRRSPTRQSSELCESRGGRPGVPVPNKPYGFYGSKAPWKKKAYQAELCESRSGRHGRPVPNKPYGFCARKATLKRNVSRPTRRPAVHNELVSRRVVTKFSAGKAVIRLDRLCRNANPTSPLLSWPVVTQVINPFTAVRSFENDPQKCEICNP